MKASPFSGSNAVERRDSSSTSAKRMPPLQVMSHAGHQPQPPQPLRSAVAAAGVFAARVVAAVAAILAAAALQRAAQRNRLGEAQVVRLEIDVRRPSMLSSISKGRRCRWCWCWRRRSPASLVRRRVVEQHRAAAVRNVHAAVEAVRRVVVEVEAVPRLAAVDQILLDERQRVAEVGAWRRCTRRRRRVACGRLSSPREARRGHRNRSSRRTCCSCCSRPVRPAPSSEPMSDEAIGAAGAAAMSPLIAACLACKREPPTSRAACCQRSSPP